ncbi:CooT family nickel-binding protein [Candidatus Bathyarchaeota archaeon]|nr:CooT family nickel-binding protein [Candidatus Bathyarchaeota archaeon]
MSFKVFLYENLIMDKVLLVKANEYGVALKDDFGVSKIIDKVYISEVDGYRNFIVLHYFGK